MGIIVKKIKNKKEYNVFKAYIERLETIRDEDTSSFEGIENIEEYINLYKGCVEEYENK
tara:strand:- start:22608 stop:22784 length:177 start_codon:yes stop_codon:yes gene_type:complete